MKTKDEYQEWIDSLDARYDLETPEHRHHRQTWLGMVVLVIGSLLGWWGISWLAMEVWNRPWTGGDLLILWLCVSIVAISVAILGTRRPKQ